MVHDVLGVPAVGSADVFGARRSDRDPHSSPVVGIRLPLEKALGFEFVDHPGQLVALGLGYLAEELGWKMAFFVVGAPGVLLAVVTKMTLHEPERGSFDASCFVLCVAGCSEVSTLATDGLVQFSGDCARSKITPSDTNWSIAGVSTRLFG